MNWLLISGEIYFTGFTNLIYLTLSWEQGLSVTQLPEDTPNWPHVHCLSVGSPEKHRNYYLCGKYHNSLWQPCQMGGSSDDDDEKGNMDDRGENEVMK